MNKKMPHTPLSTHLSGSAKETEIRIRNIFSGPKKRPPLPLLALMCAVCLLCGNLVSCQTREAEEPDNTPNEVQTGLTYNESTDDPHYLDRFRQALFERSQNYDPEMGGGALLERWGGTDLDLVLAWYSPGAHTGGLYNLLLGTFDQEENLVDFYEIFGDAGLYSSWEEGGVLHLLCTNTVTWQGWESGGAPMYFRFDGKRLEGVDTPPASFQVQSQFGDLRGPISQWDGYNHKYLPIPGGLEVYRRTEGWSNIDEKWYNVPQWEYQGTVYFSSSPLPFQRPLAVPETVYQVARTYIDQTEYAGTPIYRLEQAAEWTDFTGISLCQEWQEKENLTVVSWDLEYHDPSEMTGLSRCPHLLFLKEGDRLTFLTTFYDGELSAPEPTYLAGLSPYNWYASVALADEGYLTARPRMDETITLTPTPDAAWKLAENWCGNHPEAGLTVESLEPVELVITRPGWTAVYRMNESYYAFFEISDFRMFHNCLTIRPESGVFNVSHAALSAYHGLLDASVALWDQSQGPGLPQAVGPGPNRSFFLTVYEENHVDVNGSWTGTGDRFEAHFHSVAGNESGWGSMFTDYLDTTRRLYTEVGITIGDSLDKVRAEYLSTLRNDPTTGAWVYHGEQGAVMEFYFENDILSRIVLKCT